MFRKLILLTASFMMVAACSTQQTIYNIDGSLVPTKPDGSLMSMEEVQAAIRGAAAYKRWSVKSVDEDTLRAEITVRARHHAVVDIDYSQLSYNITLTESDGLDESGGKIHRNYNKWVILLDEQIQAELERTAATD